MKYRNQEENKNNKVQNKGSTKSKQENIHIKQTQQTPEFALTY